MDTLPRIPPSRCTGTFHEDYLTDDNWVAEPKLDGGRYMLYLEYDGSVHLFSRRDFPRIDKAANVPQIAKRYPGLEGTIFDGEILLPGGKKLGDTTGILNSATAKAIATQKEVGELHYHVWDVLHHGGQDLRNRPLRERRALLEKIVRKMNNPCVELVPQTQDKDGLFRSILAAGGEGTVLKNLECSYGIQWVKNKRVADFSVIISGYKPGNGKYEGSLGAVAVSVYQVSQTEGYAAVIAGRKPQAELVEVGFASGMTDTERADIWKNREAYLGRVIDVSAQEVTPGGRLRHPRWLRFRDDIDPKTLTFEKLLDDAKKARRAVKK